jgi:hypothetical protein
VATVNGPDADRLTLALAPEAGPGIIDGLLLELLRAGDGDLLEELARRGAPRAMDPTIRAVLEAIARSGRGRASALGALRATGGPTATSARPAAAAASRPIPPPAPPAMPAAPKVATPSAAIPPRMASEPGPEAIEPDWTTAFEAALADPSPATLAPAALALLDLEGKRPASATVAEVKELAAKLAMAAIDQSGEVQQGLARLARGLKALV